MFTIRWSKCLITVSVIVLAGCAAVPATRPSATETRVIDPAVETTKCPPCESAPAATPAQSSSNDFESTFATVNEEVSSDFKLSYPYFDLGQVAVAIQYPLDSRGLKRFTKVSLHQDGKTYLSTSTGLAEETKLNSDGTTTRLWAKDGKIAEEAVSNDGNDLYRKEYIYFKELTEEVFLKPFVVVVSEMSFEVPREGYDCLPENIAKVQEAVSLAIPGAVIECLDEPGHDGFRFKELPEGLDACVRISFLSEIVEELFFKPASAVPVVFLVTP